MNDNTPKSEKCTVYGKNYDIIGYVSTDERYKGKRVDKNTPGAVPLLDIKMMSDFKWQYLSLMSRIESPEDYVSRGEDVPAIIEKLKQWLIAHLDFIGDLKPEEQRRLLNILHEAAIA